MSKVTARMRIGKWQSNVQHEMTGTAAMIYLRRGMENPVKVDQGEVRDQRARRALVGQMARKKALKE